MNKTVKQLAAQPPPYRDSFWYNGAVLCYAVLAAALPGGDPLKYFAKGARRQITLRGGGEREGKLSVGNKICLIFGLFENWVNEMSLLRAIKIITENFMLLEKD